MHAINHVRYTTAALLMKNGLTPNNIIGLGIGSDLKNSSRKVIYLAEPSLKIPRNYLLMVRKSVIMHHS